MAITKIIYQDANEALVNAVYRNGESLCSLLDYDSGVKSASSQLVSKDLLEKYRPTNEKTAAIHLIAMGNSDQYGFNRNGDYFAGDVLEKRAHTFVTNGHVFREHNNKDPKKALGQVKWAGYDPKGMQRVELIVHIDKDKAEEEYEMAKQGKALNFSMACRVPNDRCSCCGNEAKSVSAYCPHLRSHMGQYMGDFSKYAFAYNDNPTFFDISRVGQPADRIARHLSYMFKESGMHEMAKVASAGDALIPSAMIAMAQGINRDIFEMDEMGMIRKLAAAEEYVNSDAARLNADSDVRAYNACYIFPHAMREKFAAAELETARNMKPENFFRKLASKDCLLSFPAFCQYITGNENVVESPVFRKAACMLPMVFRDMMEHMMHMAPETQVFRMGSPVMCACDDTPSDSIDQLMDQAEDKFSMREEPVRHRVIQIVIRIGGSPSHCSHHEKEASLLSDEQAANVARCYAQYQVRALCDMQDLHGSDHITPAMCDMVAGANSALVFDNPA